MSLNNFFLVIRNKTRTILNAPDTDLLNVSTDHVRKVLVEKGIPVAFVVEHKTVIDEMIWKVFFEVLSDKEELEHSNMEDLVSALGEVRLSKEAVDKSNMMDTLTAALDRTQL